MPPAGGGIPRRSCGHGQGKDATHEAEHDPWVGRGNKDWHRVEHEPPDDGASDKRPTSGERGCLQGYHGRPPTQQPSLHLADASHSFLKLWRQLRWARSRRHSAHSNPQAGRASDAPVRTTPMGVWPVGGVVPCIAIRSSLGAHTARITPSLHGVPGLVTLLEPEDSDAPTTPHRLPRASHDGGGPGPVPRLVHPLDRHAMARRTAVKPSRYQQKREPE